VLPDWLDPATLQDVVFGGLIGIGVIAVLVMRFIRKVLLRVVLVGLLAGMGAVMYVEREALSDCAADCSCDFLGFDVDVPACADRIDRQG